MTEVIFKEHADLTREEQLTKLLDEVICIWTLQNEAKSGKGLIIELQNLFNDYERLMSQAMKAIAAASVKNKDYPTTAFIAQYLRENGYWGEDRTFHFHA